MPVFQTSRHLPAAPEMVFAAFASAERLARWWGPSGFTNTFDTFEFISGGMWKFTMHGPDGTDYLNESTFVEIIPDSKVVIRHVCEPLFTLTITLSTTGTGTLLSWVQALDNPAICAAISHIVEPANEQNLDRLTAELTGAKIT